ncbi:MAG: sulfite exporter TauE/SafE family protein [Defluviitaleaceae bacterium]|nr:sulfite exporter TauE/SafE family protein [Defluviitaleaceae bacterium]
MRNPNIENSDKSEISPVKSAIVGSVTGIVNGLFGSGGGAIFIPLSKKFLKLSVHTAHATAVAIILPLSITSSFVYLRGNEVDWKMLIFICIGGVAGGIVGAKLLTKIPKKWLKRLFGLFMIAAAVKMLI